MTDSAIKYVGVDGCKAGWIGVGLDDGDGWQVEVCGSFTNLLTHFGDACVVLVDMPIGLRESGAMEFRSCDDEARDRLAKRKGSVFQVPSQEFVNKVMKKQGWNQTTANKWLMKKFKGNKISSQGFGIIRKIGEVGEYLRFRTTDLPKIREAHPEVCFWALNGKQPLSAHKSEAFGLWERFKIIQCSLHESIDVLDIFKDVRPRESKNRVGPDDVLDALALAITAKLGCQNKFRRLPKKPAPDCVGEMVYALHKDKTTQC